MLTYQEPVGRYVVLKHTDLPEAHKAEYRADGINPDTIWSLYYSTSSEADAKRVLAESIEEARSYQTFRFEDRGAPSVIERPAY